MNAVSVMESALQSKICRAFLWKQMITAFGWLFDLYGNVSGIGFNLAQSAGDRFRNVYLSGIAFCVEHLFTEKGTGYFAGIGADADFRSIAVREPDVAGARLSREFVLNNHVIHGQITGTCLRGKSLRGNVCERRIAGACV